MSRFDMAVRILAGAVGAGAVALAVYSGSTALAGDVGAGPVRFYLTVLALTGALAGVLAVVVAFRAGPGRDATIFTIFLAAVALVVLDEGRFRGLEPLLGGWLPSWPGGWQRVVWYGATAVMAAATVRIPQLFPRVLEPAMVRSAPGPRWLRAAQVRLLGPWPAWLGFGVVGWLALMVLDRWLSGAMVLATLLFDMAALTAAILYFRVAYAAGDDEDRRRIFWFLEAGLITAVAVALGFWVELATHVFGAQGPVLRWLHGALIPLGLLATVVVLAIAILYQGALDSRLVVRKTLLYGLLGFTLTALFVGIETLVEEVLSARMGLPDRAGGYVAGILAALVFGPLRSAIEGRLPD